MAAKRWYTIWGTFDAASGRATVGQRPWQPLFDGSDAGEASETTAHGAQIGLANVMTMAAWSDKNDSFGGHFNGKIHRPRVAKACLEGRDLAALGNFRVPDALRSRLLGAWDFALETPTDRIMDSGPMGLHGSANNIPVRAMKGPEWDGAFHRWFDKPEYYGAIHFHDDDLYDAAWDTDVRWTLPADLPSGVFGVRLSSRSGEDTVPFFVRPPRGSATADVAFLAATATHLAYGNFHELGDGDQQPPSEAGGGALVMTVEDAFLFLRSDYGGSTYCLHSDGTGRCYSSRLRPLLSMRPNMPLWGYGADGYLLSWLRREGHAVDVLTDEDLHEDGAKLLAPYRVVLTGCHPEYYSAAMLSALQGYVDCGGRLMYLGGNGFFWRAAFPPGRADMIEVRRAEDGPRTWAAEPGEYYMSFTGEYGGLWRRNGRPPNALVGVGFCAQGFQRGAHYRRTEASDDPRAGFIFEGIDDRVIGDFGLCGDGAAGQEIDCADIDQGTPPHALVLARSEGHTDDMLLGKETYLQTKANAGGAANPDLVHADIVFFETAAGGAVFSVGSISWCSSLSWNDFRNNVALMTGNVLTRFLDPRPFTPGGR